MNRTLVRCSGGAALAGGFFWVIKAGAIMITGDQPDYLFEVAPLLFAVGLIGLHVLLEGRGANVARAGGALAYFSCALSLLGAILYASGSLETSEEDVNPLVFGSFLSVIVSLILLGIAYRRSEESVMKWRSLPLIMGVATFPLLMIGGAVLEAINARLFEVPILVLGAGWMVLGWALVSHSPGGTERQALGGSAPQTT